MVISAPHSTFVDSLAILATGAIPMAKEELSRMPILGKIVLFMQVFLVQREHGQSRREVMDKVKAYLNTNLEVSNIQFKHLDYLSNHILFQNKTPLLRRPVLIFPEGMKYEITYSVRDQIDQSMNQVLKTLVVFGWKL